MDLDATKSAMSARVADLAPTLLSLSHDLHAHPELAFEEHHAHAVLTDAIEDAGLAVERHAGGLDTAFVASAGDRGPTIAVCIEYDALPGIGHACGHNIIATAGLGAGLAAASVAASAGGTVRLVGTPAEEGGGGKQFLIDAGVFDGVDAALMVHPSGADLTRMTAIAVQQVRASYRGAAAHAAAAPERGRNALDAAVLGYQAVAALRQHIRDGERIHGIFTDGGDKPNIVPARAQTHWYVRAHTLDALDDLKDRVARCLRAGAEAAGCEVDLEWIDPAYADMVDNEPMLRAFAANAAPLGRDVRDPEPGTAVVGSTDMGNVSHVVPAIHPMLCVRPGLAIHTEAFAEAARSADGDRAVLDGATALAHTVADLWLDHGLLERARAAFPGA